MNSTRGRVRLSAVSSGCGPRCPMFAAAGGLVGVGRWRELTEVFITSRKSAFAPMEVCSSPSSGPTLSARLFFDLERIPGGTPLASFLCFDAYVGGPLKVTPESAKTT